MKINIHHVPEEGLHIEGEDPATILDVADPEWTFREPVFHSLDATLLNDALLFNLTPNLQAFLRHAHVLKSVWHAYGWRALDQYALLTGGYPRWATFDTWPNPVAWGAPDGIDTRFWFSGGRSAHLFGQESIFDVAEGFGMQTDVVASSDYILSDATTRNLDLLQRSSTFDAVRWLAQMEDVVLSGMQQTNGFLLYGELAPLGQEDMSSSPDAQGDEYQGALLLADQTFGQFIDWLGQQGVLQNTLIALTTSIIAMKIQAMIAPSGRSITLSTRAKAKIALTIQK